MVPAGSGWFCSRSAPYHVPVHRLCALRRSASEKPCAAAAIISVHRAPAPLHHRRSSSIRGDTNRRAEAAGAERGAAATALHHLGGVRWMNRVVVVPDALFWTNFNAIFF